jgi:hypothetical protein
MMPYRRHFFMFLFKLTVDSGQLGLTATAFIKSAQYGEAGYFQILCRYPDENMIKIELKFHDIQRSVLH